MRMGLVFGLGLIAVGGLLMAGVGGSEAKPVVPPPEPEPSRIGQVIVNGHTYMIEGTNADYWINAREVVTDDEGNQRLETAAARIQNGHITEFEGGDLGTQIALDFPSFPEKVF